MPYQRAWGFRGTKSEAVWVEGSQGPSGDREEAGAGGGGVPTVEELDHLGKVQIKSFL